MSSSRAQCYWDNKGKHQALYEQLHKLIPQEGSVDNARSSNRALEKLRVASNCYYDLFNNGLINRAAEFRRVFGFGGTEIAQRNFRDTSAVDKAMDEIILNAAHEQGLLAQVSAADVAEMCELLKELRACLGDSEEDQQLAERIAKVYC